MTLYHPNPELGPDYISGVNPSISMLVLSLQAWGIKTIESHAGFYPGDPEEQEYWIQKKGLDEDGRKTYEGPIVLMGVGHDPPHVIFWATTNQVNRLTSLLPNGWHIAKYHRLRPRDDYEAYTLTYHALQSFSDATNAFWKRYLPFLVPDPEDLVRELEAEEIQRINQEYHQQMPLTKEEYNHVRDEAIQLLSERLLGDITQHEVADIKKRVDQLITWQEEAEFLEVLIEILHEELGERRTHHLIELAQRTLRERNRHE